MHFRGHRAYHTPVSSKHPLRSPAVPLKQVSTPRQFQPLPQSCTSCSEGSSLRSPTRYLAEDQKLSRKGFCLTIDPGSTGNMAFTSNKMKKEYWQIPKMTRSHTHKVSICGYFLIWVYLIWNVEAMTSKHLRILGSVATLTGCGSLRLCMYHCAIHCTNQPPRLCQLDGNHSAIHINHPPAASPNFSSASEVTEHILLQKIQRWWPNAPAIEQLQILTWLAQRGSSEAGNSTWPRVLIKKGHWQFPPFNP